MGRRYRLLHFKNHRADSTAPNSVIQSIYGRRNHSNGGHPLRHNPSARNFAFINRAFETRTLPDLTSEERCSSSRASIPGSQRTHLHGTVAFRTLAQLTEHGHRFPPRCLPGRRQWWRHPAGRFITIIIASTVDEEEEDSLFTSSLLFTSFTCHQPYIHGT